MEGLASTEVLTRGCSQALFDPADRGRRQPVIAALIDLRVRYKDKITSPTLNVSTKTPFWTKIPIIRGGRLAEGHLPVITA